jgi:hypothetical protein
MPKVAAAASKVNSQGVVTTTSKVTAPGTPLQEIDAVSAKKSTDGNSSVNASPAPGPRRLSLM